MIETFCLQPGITLRCFTDQRFKQSCLSLQLIRPMRPEEAALNALIPVVKRKYQTLSYIGVDKEMLGRFVVENGLRGIDRIAPVGHTMDFALTWDGHDLIRSLSRRISVL